MNSAKTITGASHFESLAAASNYYSAYERDGMQAARRKLQAGEIHIGPPTLKPGETLSLNKEEGRYFITS